MNNPNKSKEEFLIKIQELQMNYNTFNKTFEIAVNSGKQIVAANRLKDEKMNTTASYKENYFG